MNRDQVGGEGDATIGLCGRCCNARVQDSAKGSRSRFWRCALADENESYLRYPPLPVQQCAGFRATSVADLTDP